MSELQFNDQGVPLHPGSYRLRRFFNWFPLGLTYAFLYMGRYNLTVSKLALGDMMSNSDFGTIFAAGTVTYALAFLVNGPLTDRIGGKRAILIGASGSAVMNALMGLVTWMILVQGSQMNLTVVFSLLYSVNMYFQSFGAVSIVKVNAQWFHIRERGVFGAIFGILISMGIYFAFDWGFAIVQATQAQAANLGFFQEILRSVLCVSGSVDQTWWVFFVPAIILSVFFVIDIFIVKDSPEQAGQPELDTGDASSGEEDKPFALKEVLLKIITNPVILTIAMIEFCSGVMRNGLMHWYPIYLKDMDFGKDYFFRSHWGLLLMIAGITGGIFAGFVSDKIFQSRRGPVAAVLYGVMIVGTVVMYLTLKSSDFGLGATVIFMSMAVIGVHGMLSGTATMDFGGKRNAATAVGMIDGFVYLGTAVQSISLGFLTEKSWALWPPFLLPFAILGLILALRIWRAFPGK